MGTQGSQGSIPRSRHAAPSTNSMVANSMEAAAMATPALLSAGQPLASPPLVTHSPSPMSPSLQTLAVTVSSPSMPVAADKQRKGLVTMDAVACKHFYPPSRQSFPCILVVSLQNPTPKCQATTPKLGVGWHHMLKGYQTPGIAGKNPQLVENTHCLHFLTLSPNLKPIPLPFSLPT